MTLPTVRRSRTLPVAGVERRKGRAAAGDRLDSGRIGSGGGCHGSTDLFVAAIGRESRAPRADYGGRNSAERAEPRLILLTSCRIAPAARRRYQHLALNEREELSPVVVGAERHRRSLRRAGRAGTRGSLRHGDSPAATRADRRWRPGRRSRSRRPAAAPPPPGQCRSATSRRPDRLPPRRRRARRRLLGTQG